MPAWSRVARSAWDQLGGCERLAVGEKGDGPGIEGVGSVPPEIPMRAIWGQYSRVRSDLMTLGNHAADVILVHWIRDAAPILAIDEERGLDARRVELVDDAGSVDVGAVVEGESNGIGSRAFGDDAADRQSGSDVRDGSLGRVMGKAHQMVRDGGVGQRSHAAAGLGASGRRGSGNGDVGQSREEESVVDHI